VHCCYSFRMVTSEFARAARMAGNAQVPSPTVAITKVTSSIAFDARWQRNYVADRQHNDVAFFAYL
jgi:hypothetical protein